MLASGHQSENDVSNGRRFAFVAFTLTALIVAIALIAEISYRIIVPSPEVFDLRALHEFRPDREWLYRGRPGVEATIDETTYAINADGFRGPVALRPRDPESTRVLVLGDSIAFGYGVREDQTFPRVLESLAREDLPEAKVEVVNLGTGGYSAWNQARLLEDVGPEYAPDIVLVQFCINDLNDPTIHFGGQTRLLLGGIPDGAFPDPARGQGVHAGRSLMLRACQLSRLCVDLREQSLADVDFSKIKGADAVAALAPVERTDTVQWRWLEKQYEDMAAVAESQGARFAILAFPYRRQLGRPLPHPVPTHLAALAKKKGWLLIDPLPAFHAARRQGQALFLDGWHPSVDGQRVAAEESLRIIACDGAMGRSADSIADPNCETL